MSVTVLRCIGDDPAFGFGTVVRLLKKPRRHRPGAALHTIAETELDAASGDVIAGFDTLTGLEIDQLFGQVNVQASPPGWALPGSGFTDLTHELTLVLRRGELIAVRAEKGVAERLQRQLDKPPRPPLRRLPTNVLEAAFLQGAAKNIWLRSVQRPSSRRPYSKALGGTDLGVALDPVEDSSFAWGAARSEMLEDPGILYLKGKVGVTAGKSQIWFKDSTDFHQYLLTVGEILRVSSEILTDPGIFSAFPGLAQEVSDPAEISGAYEVIPIQPDETPEATSGGDEVVAAAELLQDAVLEVREGATGTRFTMDVGLEGASSGRLAASLNRVDDRFVLSIGFDRTAPQPLPAAEQILGALNTGDMLEVHFGSGHKYSAGKVWKQNFSPIPFSGWLWEDFDGYRITREKPAGAEGAQAIHDAIHENGDDSLFAWIVDYCSEGWLLCDDSSGEAADFFHLDADNLLRIFHVKASSNSSPRRGVKVTDYEVVVSQALKNLTYMDRRKLIGRLSRPSLADPASWIDGDRVHDKGAGFLEKLEAAGAQGRTEVVIVQPNLSRGRYRQLTADIEAGIVSRDTLRLQLLEMLLKTARLAAVRYVTDLTVIGSG
ncbi:hypothetical protein [Amycolatopsis methanolica]|uniref:hypothetical protein n=1 Tax=Amycolatopsis methanolica TaxID=1814 RepID=UPI00341E9CBA